MTDVGPLLPVLGTMGAAAPLVRRRKNGIRGPRWDVVECTRRVRIGSSSRRRAWAGRTTTLGAASFC
jgi:hypothetical protein